MPPLKRQPLWIVSNEDDIPDKEGETQETHRLYRHRVTVQENYGNADFLKMTPRCLTELTWLFSSDLLKATENNCLNREPKPKSQSSEFAASFKSSRNCDSVKTGIFNLRAFSSLLPAASPATT